jgi:hypothetical protein
MEESPLKEKGREMAERPFKTRVVRGKPADREFDIDFWQAQGDDAIFAAAWELIVLAEEVRHGKQPTFQRTVTKVIRNKQAAEKPVHRE